jgi:quinol-cytochrome oxidoreductase complex cytochrome b subunit
MALVAQVFRGLFLLLNYNSLEGYDRVMFITYEVGGGWFFKVFHQNNARFIFIILYLHLFKNLSVYGYRNSGAWRRGLLIMLLIMGAAFRGYVLIRRHISFWAAMVITSLVRVIPLNGEKLLYFVWGGYSITWVTYQLLLVAHFLLPFMVLLIIILHLNLLHLRGRTSPLLHHSGVRKVRFYPYYWVKDAINVVGYLGFVVLILLFPYALGEVELYEEANPINSPLHIVPEWYFCAQYAILRRVPDKGIGVILILLSIMVFFLYPMSVGYVTPGESIGVVS